jgi:Lrp/AsnC family transcriptional regulator for asnA, asnC and gidA
VKSVTPLDELDRMLIASLQANARESYEDLARKLSVSASTVRRRVERLLSSGTLKLVAVPSWPKLGMNLVAFIALSVELPRLRRVAAELAKMDEICWVAFVTGAYDLFAQVVLPANEDFIRFVTHRVAPIDGIRDLQTFMVPEFVKSFEEYRLPVRPDPLYLKGDVSEGVERGPAD